MNEHELLRAIADHPFDERLRLAYANWLHESGDPRGEYLNLQLEFSKPVQDRDTYRRLCETERALLGNLDPVWLHRFQWFTTAPPCRHIVRLVPELADFARTTFRLHPHRSVGELPLGTSKIGGTFLWPDAEDWPHCPDCDVPLIAVLQMRNVDAPHIAYAPGSDLLQLLWCPYESVHDYRPKHMVIWRRAAEIDRLRTENPDFSSYGITKDDSELGGLLPFPCSVYPERVVEYLVSDDLYQAAGSELAKAIAKKIEKMDLGSTDDLAERLRFEHDASDASYLAHTELTHCSASRVGGKPGFREHGLWYDHLVTLATWEFDSAGFRRWLPIEDQRRLAEPGEPLTYDRLFGGTCDFQSLQAATGLELGRTQCMHLYVCRDTDPWRTLLRIYD